MAARFFADHITVGEIALSAQEAQHAAGARRLKTGEEVELFDGCGTVGEGKILTAKSREVIVAIESVRQVEPAAQTIEIAVAVPKGKRLQYMVEKVTELGCSVIRPVVFERSIAAGGSDPVDRWGRWALEACKQCGRYFLPTIEQPVSFAEFLTQISTNDGKMAFLADAAGEPATMALNKSAQASCALIGPEGGLSEEEFELAAQAGMERISLGSHILRIETAAVAFCAIAAVR